MNINTGEGMNVNAAGRDEVFWRALLDHIVEKGRRTPKVQVERSIGPILGFFLEQAVSDLLKVKCLLETPPFLDSDVVTLATEFPLKKSNNQSTNIDWLMYDKINNKLLLVELKTESTSFGSEQLETYLNLAAAKAPWESMRNDLNAICRASKSKKKYEHTQSELSGLSKAFPEIKEAPVEVVYLAPLPSAKSFDAALRAFKVTNPQLALAIHDNVRFYSFESLNLARSRERGDFALYREALYKALQALDKKVDYSAESLSSEIASKCEGLV